MLQLYFSYRSAGDGVDGGSFKYVRLSVYSGGCCTDVFRLLAWMLWLSYLGQRSGGRSSS